VASISPSSLEAVIPCVAGVVGLLIGFGKGATVEKSGSETARKVLRWVSPALIVFGIFLFVSDCASQPADAEALASGMKAKMTLPVQVDDDTRLDDVRAISKKELGYFLTLTRLTKSQVDANPIAKQLESNLRGGACKDPSYLKLFKAGISVRLTYQTQDHAEVCRVVMVPKDCGL
jgi:hypothetical protein